MDYLDEYIKLIEENSSTVKVSGSTQSHHIIPNSWVGGAGSEGQKHFDQYRVNLSHGDHVMAHWYLWKAFGSGKDAQAVKLMVGASDRWRDMSESEMLLISDSIQDIKSHAISSMSAKLSGRTKHTHKYLMRKSEQTSIQMTGENNPSKRSDVRAKLSKASSGSGNGMFGVKPWNHPNANEDSMVVWRDASKALDWWSVNGHKKRGGGKGALAEAMSHKYCQAHCNIIKKFRSGWVPSEDPSWVSKFK